MTAPGPDEALIARTLQGGVLADPALAAQLHERGPLLRGRTTLVVGHALARALLRHPQLHAGGIGWGPETHHTGTYAVMREMMIGHDGPAHTRLRALAVRAFTPRVLEETREFITEVTRELLRAARASEEMSGEVEFMSAVAYPLPVTVILHLLGLEGTDAERFRLWCQSLFDRLGGVGLSAQREAEIEEHAWALLRHFGELAGELRRSPRPGLISALARAEVGGERLSDAEVVSNAVMLLMAGYETTADLLAGSVALLDRNPGARSWLEADPQARAAPTTEEFLRLTSPVQYAPRRVAAALQVGGHAFEADEVLVISLAAANLDPQVFPEPLAVRPERPNAADHLAFAAGAHACLGASLARMEGQIFLRELLDLCPDFVVCGEAPLRPNSRFQGYQRLPVRLGGPAR